MFRQGKFPCVKVEPEIIQRLNKVLIEYQKLACSDPAILRLLIPSNELWRLFIDGVRQKDDTWLGFEVREEGYLEALYTAFQALFDPATELDVNLIKRLHKLATQNVEGTNYSKDYNMKDTGEFRDDKQEVGGFYLGSTDYLSNTTIDGLVEFLRQTDHQLQLSLQLCFLENFSTTFEDLILSKECLHAIRAYVTGKVKDRKVEIDPDDMINHLHHYFDHDIRRALLRSNCLEKTRLAEIIKAIGLTRSDHELAAFLCKIMRDPVYDNDFAVLILSKQPKPVRYILTWEIEMRIKRFKRSINAAASPIEKLSAIVSFIRSCEHLHAFSDANCRTFCMLIHAYLLMRQGFPLAIMNDPNSFDAFSHKELINEAITGMENTLRLIREGKLFDVATDAILRSATTYEAAYFADCVKIEEQGRVRTAKRQRCTR